MEKFEPEIVAFCCQYCAYTAADMAGSMHLSYPTNVKIIRVPCSGRVDTIHMMKALEKGADGVLIASCLDGDCHFKNGNTEAARRVALVRRLLQEVGIEPERLAMVTMSAGMGTRFAQIATEFTEAIRELGPNPVCAALSEPSDAEEIAQLPDLQQGRRNGLIFPHGHRPALG